MIAVVLIALLAAAALAYVAVPLLQGPRREAALPSSTSTEARAAKTAALAAIVELEEERQMGKISKPDFERLKETYEAEAVAALKKVDTLASPLQPDAMEAEIAAAKKRLECPTCGAPRMAGDRCAGCSA